KFAGCAHCRYATFCVAALQQHVETQHGATQHVTPRHRWRNRTPMLLRDAWHCRCGYISFAAAYHLVSCGENTAYRLGGSPKQQQTAATREVTDADDLQLKVSSNDLITDDAAVGSSGGCGDGSGGGGDGVSGGDVGDSVAGVGDSVGAGGSGVDDSVGGVGDSVDDSVGGVDDSVGAGGSGVDDSVGSGVGGSDNINGGSGDGGAVDSSGGGDGSIDGVGGDCGGVGDHAAAAVADSTLVRTDQTSPPPSEHQVADGSGVAEPPSPVLLVPPQPDPAGQDGGPVATATVANGNESRTQQEMMERGEAEDGEMSTQSGGSATDDVATATEPGMDVDDGVVAMETDSVANAEAMEVDQP
ncbi:PREDICTED: circumsporozoite protein-like, partial [Priapulus caudatus]|uniref:Circumsporozoite protein-like n=1 Tax=Priapulus caudatus TaxID=37621 RepID=A0ABM1F6S2_PRICU